MSILVPALSSATTTLVCPLCTARVLSTVVLAGSSDPAGAAILRSFSWSCCPTTLYVSDLLSRVVVVVVVEEEAVCSYLLSSCWWWCCVWWRPGPEAPEDGPKEVGGISRLESYGGWELEVRGRRRK